MRKIISVIVLLSFSIFLFVESGYSDNSWSRSYLGGGKKRFSTGFFINSEYIITNQHAIDKCGRYMARTKKGDVIILDLVAYDMLNDLAVLKARDFKTKAYGYLHDGSEIKNRSVVHIVGYPNNRYGYITSKVIGANKLIIDGPPFYEKEVPKKMLVYDSANDKGRQTSYIGNSGGAVLNEQGLVVGVVYGYFYENIKRNGVVKQEKVEAAIRMVELKKFLLKNKIPFVNAENSSGYSSLKDEQIEHIGNQFIVQTHCKIGR